MLTRDELIKKMEEFQVMANQSSTRTDIIIQTATYMLLQDIESRLTAIEINTMNAQGLPFDEPTTSGPSEPATPASSSETSSTS